MFWINLLRVVIIVMCLASLILMARDFRVHGKGWNEKTRDYWYGRNMWTLTGLIGCVEGIVRGVPFRYTLIFFTVAALVTLKGNMQRGGWGNGN